MTYNNKIILGSGSPRRRELLEQLTLNFEVIVGDLDESKFSGLSGDELVKKLSYEKAKEIFNKLDKINDLNICIIGCDTLVCIDDKILGKPLNNNDALTMLKLLNNKKHEVLTGLTILGIHNNKYFEETICSKSIVTFSEFTEDELKKYVDTGEPLDKAGSYGIQGKGSFLVDSIEGDYYSIMGLPINKLYKMLKYYNFL